VNAVTKVERVVEAIESMTVSVNAMQNSSDGVDRVRLFEVVQDSRKELRDALAEFLKPTLRVIA
jgi:hypothetical protein